MHHERVIDNLPWRTSSRCASNGCVQVAQAGDVYVRDSKPGAGDGVLRFERRAWTRFVDWVRREAALDELVRLGQEIERPGVLPAQTPG